MNPEKQSSTAITRLIQRAAENDEQARNALYRAVYEDLKAAAHNCLRRNRNAELHTTALVHEVVLRFEKANSLAKMSNRRVFFSVASQAMRQVLIDHHRRRQSRISVHKQGGELLDLAVRWIEDRFGFDLERLQTALDALEGESPRQHAVTMHRFFAGLSVSDTAKLLGVSERTVERDWKLAKAKLLRTMKRKGMD